MPELTISEIEQISHYVRKQNITYTYLAEELIDHICCDVEDEMTNGLGFTDAYHKVLRMMGPGRIKEIQEETLYAIDKKYRTMKNLMKISGVAGTVALIFGAMLKIMHFPGAGILMTPGALLLALLFLPSSLSVLWKETHNRRSLLLFISAFVAGVLFISGTLFKIQHWPGAGIVLISGAISFIFLFVPALLAMKLKDQENRVKRLIYITGAIGAISYAAGILFKIQHWPAATLMMVLGVMLLCLIAFPWYTWVTWRSESQVDVRFIFMVTAFLLILVPGALITLNMQNRFDQGFYSALGKQQILFDYQFKANKSRMDLYRDSSCHTNLVRLDAETDTLLRLVRNLQSEMAGFGSSNIRTPRNSAERSNNKIENGIQPLSVSDAFRPGPAREYLYPGTIPRKHLEKALSDYMISITEITSPEAAHNYKVLLDPGIYLPEGLSGQSEISLISGLHALELLGNGILAVESKMISVITANNHKN